jgi:importin subunit alpha-2
LCQFGAVAPLCTLLETKKPKTIVVVLDGLANILAAAKKMGELEKVSLDVRVCGGLDLIEVLVIHNNVDISHKSLAVLKQYFSTDVNYFILWLIFRFFFFFMITSLP